MNWFSQLGKHIIWQVGKHLSRLSGFGLSPWKCSLSIVPYCIYCRNHIALLLKSWKQHCLNWILSSFSLKHEGYRFSFSQDINHREIAKNSFKKEGRKNQENNALSLEIFRRGEWLFIAQLNVYMLSHQKHTIFFLQKWGGKLLVFLVSSTVLLRTTNC